MTRPTLIAYFQSGNLATTSGGELQVGCYSWFPGSSLPSSIDRRGHYIVSEYVDKFRNKYNPTFPRQVGWSGHLIRPDKLLIRGLAVCSKMSSLNLPQVYRHNILSQFGESQVVSRNKMPQIIQAIIR